MIDLIKYILANKNSVYYVGFQHFTLISFWRFCEPALRNNPSTWALDRSTEDISVTTIGTLNVLPQQITLHDGTFIKGAPNTVLWS